jgi:hypothetical protein
MDIVIRTVPGIGAGAPRGFFERHWASHVGLYPFGGIRQDIFLLPMIYVCTSIGLENISTWLFKHVNHGGKRIIEFLLIAALVLPGLRATYVHLQSPGGQPMRPVVNELRDKFRAGDRTLRAFHRNPCFSILLGRYI